jgi:hypothetical protein
MTTRIAMMNDGWDLGTYTVNLKAKCQNVIAEYGP